MAKLADKRVLITGGAKGIGAAAAAGMLGEGARVMIADVDIEEATKLAASLGEGAAACTLDVRDADAWEAGVEATVERFGGLDVLVNNAGFGGGHIETLETMEPDLIRQIVDVNLIGTIFGHRAAAPAIRAAGGGSIINVSSTTGALTMNGFAVYAATKAAINSLTKTAALELGPDIRVNAVLPGSVHTDMSNLMGMDYETFSSTLGGMPLKRAARAEEIAAPIIFFASEEGRHCTGAELLIDAGQATGIYFQMLPGHPDTPFHKLTKAGPDKFKD
ncbi:MAG: SDR family oxidoreductase [Pseudomonadota bacterium]